MERSVGLLENIHYRSSTVAWGDYPGYVEDLIIRSGARRVLELGGGANPAIPLDFLRRHGIEYTVLDISPTELAKAPDHYRKVCGDIGSPSMSFDGIDGSYDIVFSKMLAEHVKNGEQMHRNVFRLLAPGGKAVHYFPTLYAPPFVVNRLVPERLGYWLLQWLQPGREQEGKSAKFPAYYSWCRGPTRRQIARLRGLGYAVEEYIGFFGHRVYYRKLPPVRRLHCRLADWLVKHPVPALTSSSYVLLSKPAGSMPALREQEAGRALA
ncbi:MAG TPA: class I SAM-dependent methyltransferase [Frateuria sp.]|uniref:class I SAM-dependent methyltransferase n=1 Tax=Frateuria sp. TaxID=2211372 RepID=UPI002D7F3A17|nr:class I SAM-dependent methyltransferase [Frateuria sp.]HET6806879.1 class I SAM-dependent methyltransferase [Frateuria sp.]